MKTSDVLIKPLVTEKANAQSEKHNRFSFMVSRKANKLEVKKAIEEFYGVAVADVRTLVMPGKSKSRYTKTGILSGKKPAYKKAVVTLAEGETLDLFENI